MTRACSAAFIVALLVFAASCSRCSGGEDAVRAAAERAHVKAKLDSSITLVPYKAVKLLTRSTGAQHSANGLQTAITARWSGWRRAPSNVRHLGRSGPKHAA